MLYHENEPNKEIFNILTWVLENLETDSNHSLILRYFELQLLISLGYKPNLDTCIKCQKPHLEATNYTGNFEGFICDCCNGTGKRISKSTLKALRLMASGDSAQISLLKVPDDCILEITDVIQSYLMDILPRKPKTLEL